MSTRRLGEPRDGLILCACGARFPVVDGIPVVVPDVAAWLAAHGADLLARRDLDPGLARFVAEGAGGGLWDAVQEVEVRQASQAGPLQDWIRTAGGWLAGDVLVVGRACLDREDVVAIDARFGVLRQHTARDRVVADAADAPFANGTFDAVVLGGALEVAPDPAAVMARADALLKPGGTLVIACTYAFDAAVPPAKRFTSEHLLDALARRGPFLGAVPLDYEVAEHQDALDWPIQTGPRTRVVHRTEALVARRPTDPG